MQRLGRKLKDSWAKAAAEAGGTPDLNELIARLAFLVAGVWILSLAFVNWARAPFFASPWISVAILAAFALGVVNLVMAVQAWFPARRLALIIPLSIAYLVLMNYWVFVTLVPFYGTDGMAFDHYSALVLLDGRNPYTTDHYIALDLFRIPQFFITPMEGGGVVRTQTYPALSFLLYVPFVAAGVPDMRAVSLAAHLLAVLLAYRMTPWPLKAFAPLTLALPEQLDFTPGSVQDILWVGPILLAAAHLDRARLSGALYGIACSIKPTPWLAAPFLFVYLWKRGGTPLRSARSLWTFTASAATWFLVFNLPFIAWDPAAWIAGVLDPLLGQNAPIGSGLSILTQGVWLPLPKTFYLVAMATVGIGCLATELLDFGRARYLVWWFPAIVMFFGYRSLQNYFVFWYPLVLFGLAQWFGKAVGRDRGGSAG